ncbi:MULTISPECIES: glutathione S-transferase family protein [unclassified Ruegeria]|uniref:glutathione S-transferase family protein n=1 Tax=unclassified Ruegeria TaxID=2625375 RepID=UPI001488EA99|nr:MULTISPECIES: glutathione S-transferase [unclassified Ruegeria]NOD35852.1 glutathione S-transferase [Ruegeria sp. HKCCD7296]NOE34417.1 glutathione S-transferase [Ruegeria sp. HKCCD7318]NOE40101.1 glutathione S-transferase [Ruegeria sp. HKCCD7319]
MKIYDVEGFPNPARIRIALAEKGVSDKVEFIPVDVMGGEHRTPEFKAKNPDAAVPCLELEDGSHIAQCNAITEYIDAMFDGPSLTGVTAQERARISMMNLRAENGLLNAVGTYFHHATPGLGPDLETYQCAEWGNKQKEVAENTMAYLDSVLAENDYLAGDTFSVADITAFAGLAFADFAKVEIPESLTKLRAWRAKIATRPSIAA